MLLPDFYGVLLELSHHTVRKPKSPHMKRPHGESNEGDPADNTLSDEHEQRASEDSSHHLSGLAH